MTRQLVATSPGPHDPRYYFQPPFNKVSRQRDPGQVNLNTVTGRREQTGTACRGIWSEVFDGIMHRDARTATSSIRRTRRCCSLATLGPAWRDVVLSRQGYAQFNADGSGTPLEKLDDDMPPDVISVTVSTPTSPASFRNPFRSPDAGDLVPLPQMMHYGVDAFWLRGHHFNRGGRDAWGSTAATTTATAQIDDTREAGFGGDELSYQPEHGRVACRTVSATDRRHLPLVQRIVHRAVHRRRAESVLLLPADDAAGQPRDQSLERVCDLDHGRVLRGGEGADWNDPTRSAIRQRLSTPASAATCNLYNRVYPDGYMLGHEVGSDTGDVKRHRGFYIIDRTEEVGFKPGEDLNVEK